MGRYLVCLTINKIYIWFYPKINLDELLFSNLTLNFLKSFGRRALEGKKTNLSFIILSWD